MTNNPDDVARIAAGLSKALLAAVKPFADAFADARQSYARRYGKGNESIGLSNFDAMPDGWPMDGLTFKMGEFRAIEALLTHLQEHPDD